MKDFLGTEVCQGDKIVYAIHGRYADSAPVLKTDIVDHVGTKLIICESGKRVLPRIAIVIKRRGDNDRERIQQLEEEVEYMRLIAQNAVESKCSALYELDLVRESLYYLLKGDKIEEEVFDLIRRNRNKP